VATQGHSWKSTRLTLEPETAIKPYLQFTPLPD
jgi:hypothetical protein